MGKSEGGETIITVYYIGKDYFQLKKKHNPPPKKTIKRYVSHKEVDGKLLD